MAPRPTIKRSHWAGNGRQSIEKEKDQMIVDEGRSIETASTIPTSEQPISPQKSNRLVELGINSPPPSPPRPNFVPTSTSTGASTSPSGSKSPDSAVKLPQDSSDPPKPDAIPEKHLYRGQRGEMKQDHIPQVMPLDPDHRTLSQKSPASHRRKA